MVLEGNRVASAAEAVVSEFDQPSVDQDATRAAGVGFGDAKSMSCLMRLEAHDITRSGRLGLDHEVQQCRGVMAQAIGKAGNMRVEIGPDVFDLAHWLGRGGSERAVVP